MVGGGILCWKIDLETYVAEVFFSLQFFFLFHQVFSPKLLKSICVFNRKWFLFFQELRSRLFLSDDQ